MCITKSLAERVLTIGCECNPPKGGIAQVLYNYRLFVYPTFNFVANSVDGSVFAKIWQLIKAVAQTSQTLRKNRRIKIVHIHTSSYSGFNRSKIFIRIAKVFNKKIVLHVHGGAFKEFYQTSPKSITRILDKCDCIVALSESWKLYFEGITTSKVCVVDNIIPKPKRVLNAKSDAKTHLLFLGLVTDKKGIFDLIDVIDKIRDDLNGKFCLHIGGNGEVSRLNDIIRQRDLAELVIFEGWISGERKKEMLSMADAFILPSYTEGLPISILEAMSYGLPILTTPVGGIPEVVDSSNGILFEPGNDRQMEDALRAIVNDLNLRSSMGEASRAKSSRYFPDSVSSELIKIYNEL